MLGSEENREKAWDEAASGRKGVWKGRGRRKKGDGEGGEWQGERKVSSRLRAIGPESVVKGTERALRCSVAHERR